MDFAAQDMGNHMFHGHAVKDSSSGVTGSTGGESGNPSTGVDAPMAAVAALIGTAAVVTAKKTYLQISSPFV